MASNLRDVKALTQRLIDAGVVNLDAPAADIIASLGDEAESLARSMPEASRPMIIAWGCFAVVTDCQQAAPQPITQGGTGGRAKRSLG